MEHSEQQILDFIGAHQELAAEVAAIYGIPKALILAQAVYHFDQVQQDKAGIPFPNWNSGQQQLAVSIGHFPMNRASWDAKALQIMDNGGTILQERFGEDPIKWALGLDYLNFSGTPDYGKKLLLIMKRFALHSTI
ncbi:MAG: hypothetical protein AAFV80_24140 [Bacteroidota bacterium]